MAADVGAVRRLRSRLLLRTRARALGVRLGVLAYQPTTWSEELWNERYSAGELDYFGALTELPRYSILAGYLSYFGGEPEILDLGCGQGLLRHRLHGVAFNRYVGIDPTASAIELAGRFADERTEFVVGDPLVTDLGSFDRIVCNEVLAMVPDPGALLDRISGLLRPEGLLLTSIWRHDGDQRLWAMVDERFEMVDTVEAHNPANPVGPRGWRLTCHRRRS
jgi:2-polyprenyl-3-methyl-5-hydroxy-6-metoxy-1,4-benzoquinol methylase